MTIRAILFDLGDTVFGLGPLDTDYAPKIAPIIETARHLPGFEQHAEKIVSSIATEMREHAAANLSDEHQIEELLARHAAAIGVTLSQAQVTACAEVYGRADTVRFIQASDTISRIQAFKDAGYRVGFISNTTTLPRLMVERLDAMGLHSLFEVRVFSSELGKRKPHPSTYMAALEALDVLPGEALMVGDRMREDVIAAQWLGIAGVLTHEFRQEDPAFGTPDAVITSLPELHAVVERLNREG